MKIQDKHFIVNESTNMCLCGDYGGVALHCRDVYKMKEQEAKTSMDKKLTEAYSKHALEDFAKKFERFFETDIVLYQETIDFFASAFNVQEEHWFHYKNHQISDLINDIPNDWEDMRKTFGDRILCNLPNLKQQLKDKYLGS